MVPGASIREIPGSQLRSEPPAAGVRFKGSEAGRSEVSGFTDQSAGSCMVLMASLRHRPYTAYFPEC